MAFVEYGVKSILGSIMSCGGDIVYNIAVSRQTPIDSFWELSWSARRSVAAHGLRYSLIF